MSIQPRSQLAVALLVSAKVLGIGGLVVGAMGYRYAGGAMLALDGLFLAAVAFVGVRGSRAETQAQRVRDGEASHKRALEQMLREGTLDRYLREVREAPTASIPQDPPTTPSSPSPRPSPSPGSSA